MRLVFSHPTHERLSACKYYLRGQCSRPAEACRWSHGEVRRLSELSSYQEPDWSLLVRGCRVLAKGEKGVWTRAQVTEVTEVMGEVEYLVTRRGRQEDGEDGGEAVHHPRQVAAGVLHHL